MLRDALGKLQLNDAAFFYEPENSVALGFGFRCGFLGLLHMEIVQERLEREFDIDLITTAPSVRYRITTTLAKSSKWIIPRNFPPPTEIEKIEEPIMLATDHHGGGIAGRHSCNCLRKSAACRRILNISRPRA